jgi:hypothetical protein
MVEAVDRPTPTDTNSNPSPNPSSPTMVSPEPPVSSQVGRLFTQARSALASRVRNLLGTALPQQQDVPDGFVPIQETSSQTSAIRRVDAVTRPQEERLQNLLRDLYRGDPQVRNAIDPVLAALSQQQAAQQVLVPSTSGLEERTLERLAETKRLLPTLFIFRPLSFRLRLLSEQILLLLSLLTLKATQELLQCLAILLKKMNKRRKQMQTASRTPTRAHLVKFRNLRQRSEPQTDPLSVSKTSAHLHHNKVVLLAQLLHPQEDLQVTQAVRRRRRQVPRRLQVLETKRRKQDRRPRRRRTSRTTRKR